MVGVIEGEVAHQGEGAELSPAHRRAVGLADVLDERNLPRGQFVEQAIRQRVVVQLCREVQRVAFEGRVVGIVAAHQLVSASDVEHGGEIVDLVGKVPPVTRAPLERGPHRAVERERVGLQRGRCRNGQERQQQRAGDDEVKKLALNRPGPY